MRRTPLGRPGQELWAFYRYQEALRRPSSAALLRQIREAMTLPPLPVQRRIKGSVWAVGVVKNEADIIGAVVEHLFRQGVTAALIADNGSSDSTPEVLARLASDYPVYVARDLEPGKYQGPKITLLANAVRRAGADWIVPFDADEFWFAHQGTLAGFLRDCRADIVEASIHNLYPVEGVPFGEGQWLLEKNPHSEVKVVFRSHRYAVMTSEGNHKVRRPGRSISGLRVMHVPWRSYDQFRRKSIQGREARSRTSQPQYIGSHLRYLGGLSEEEAQEVWRGILRWDTTDKIFWHPHGPAERVDPNEWSTWDPEGVLAPAQDL